MASKRLGRRVRRSAPGRWLFRRARAGRRRPGSVATPRWSFADRVLEYDLISLPERRSSVGDLVDLFFELVEAWRITLFIEAGAKYAEASQRAAELPSTERIVAFEANPFTHQAASLELAATRVRYEPLALTNDPGEVTLHVRRSELGEPLADGQASLMAREDYPHGHLDVTVPAVTLDGYFAEVGSARIALWADVEGASDAVLTGGPETLRCVDIVLIEVESRPVFHTDQWLRPDVDAYLGRFGLVPIARDQQSRFQYNVLYVRTDRLTDTALRNGLRHWRRRRLRPG